MLLALPLYLVFAWALWRCMFSTWADLNDAHNAIMEGLE